MLYSVLEHIVLVSGSSTIRVAERRAVSESGEEIWRFCSFAL